MASRKIKTANVCPVCGQPQFAAGNGGFTCANGHGFGEPNGPLANVAPGSDSYHAATNEVAGDDPGSLLPIHPIELVVTWGEELYAPIQYHSFRSGAVSMKLTLPANSSPEDVQRAHAGAMSVLKSLSEVQFGLQCDAFLTRVGLVSKIVDAKRKG